jgi:hypothetical protein
MSIVVLNAVLSLKCFAPKTRPTKGYLARGVITGLNEYSPLSLLSPKAVRVRLHRLEEVRPAVHAPPQVAVAAICSPFSSRLQGSEFRQHYVPACENKCQTCNRIGGPNRLGLAALKSKDKLVYNMTALSAAPDA